MSDELDALWDKFLAERQPLINARNKIVDSIFWRLPHNRRKLAKIDKVLDSIDLEFHKRLQEYNKSVV